MATTVGLLEEQLRGLEEYCEREHISAEEAVRRAVERLLAQSGWRNGAHITPEERKASMRAAAGSWKHLNIDAQEFVDSLRDEWERSGDGIDNEAHASEPKPTVASARKLRRDAAFGAWKHKDIDAVEYVRALRAEWDRPWDPE